MIWNAIVDTVFYKLWWLVPSVVAILALAAFYYLYRVFGWEKIKGWILPVLAVIGALGALNRARSQGYQDRLNQEDVARKEAEDFVDDKKIEVDKLPEDKLDERFKKWEGQ